MAVQKNVDDVKTLNVQGIEITLDPERFDDYEFIELAADAGDDITALPRVFRYILGDQYETVKEHLRNDAGRVPMTAMQSFVDDLMAKAGDLKN